MVHPIVTSSDTWKVPGVYCRFLGHVAADTFQEDRPPQTFEIDSGQLITYVSGFESLNLNQCGPIRESSQNLLNTGCFTQPTHNGVKPAQFCGPSGGLLCRSVIDSTGQNRADSFEKAATGSGSIWSSRSSEKTSRSRRAEP
jgi:hypothetical protein